MAEEKKRIGGEPAFDTDRAWERFGKRIAGIDEQLMGKRGEDGLPALEAEVRARWERLQHQYEKEGAVEMKKTETLGTAQGAPAAGGAEAPKAAQWTYGTGSAWRTEKPGRRRLRRLAAGAAAAVVAVSLFTTSLGDRALAAMMQTFRVQHLAGVGISADDLATISNLLERGSPEGDRSFNLAQFGSLTQSGGGKTEIIAWDEAQKRMGGSLLQLGSSTDPEYQPAVSLTFHLNVDAVNRMLIRLGSSTTLPAQADGKAIELHVPAGIVTEGILSGKPVRLLQFGKPELTVEGGIDPATVREAVLGLPVLPESLRTKLAAIGDWQNTLPVPAFEGVTTPFQLGGHDALLATDDDSRYVFWLEGERMGLLRGSVRDFPTAADFRQAAEELVRP
ncbi:hypothetical protein [Paenibacillus sp. YN15]|uniref:hypothetical protein n=1 Tax=Paenibacillus sp. YN15 TaxID=1742774 RepID=UPI000DCF3C32|nr:hypothetical protein [Paenibacillus sp. YN15]RAU90932.1 hypothetical protein DQG13_30130 [Paenibacillus sp. YN15]